MIRSLLAMTVLLFAIPAFAVDERPYFMWADENGVLTFSQTMPRDRDVTQMTEPRELGRPGQQIATLEAMIPLPDSREYQSTQIDLLNGSARELNCLIGRRSLAQLNAFRNIFAQGPDGFWREVTPEQREQKVERSRQLIAENCDS